MFLYSPFLNGGMTQVSIPGQLYKPSPLSFNTAFYLRLSTATLEIIKQSVV